MLPLPKQMWTCTHDHKQRDSNDIKINTVRNNQSWALERNITTQTGKMLRFFSLLAPAAQQLSNVGREEQRAALCCKLATCFSLQQFTFRGTQCITPKPCQNNWNANQTPRGDFGLQGSSNLPSLVLWLILVEWNIDLGSAFCKYLPHGHQEGPKHQSKRGE